MNGKKKKKIQQTGGREAKAKKEAGHVEFFYHAPEATRVCVAGEFNDWNTESHPLKKDTQGL